MDCDRFLTYLQFMIISPIHWTRNDLYSSDRVFNNRTINESITKLTVRLPTPEKKQRLGGGEEETVLAASTSIGSYQFLLSDGSCTNVMFDDEILGCLNMMTTLPG
jgi:hypothetical protein